jgi:hypothetical protein
VDNIQDDAMGPRLFEHDANDFVKFIPGTRGRLGILSEDIPPCSIQSSGPLWVSAGDGGKPSFANAAEAMGSLPEIGWHDLRMGLNVQFTHRDKPNLQQIAGTVTRLEEASMTIHIAKDNRDETFDRATWDSYKCTRTWGEFSTGAVVSGDPASDPNSTHIFTLIGTSQEAEALQLCTQLASCVSWCQRTSGDKTCWLMTDSKAATAMFKAAAGEPMGPVVHRQLMPFALLARDLLTSLPHDVKLVVGRQTSHSWYVGSRWADSLTHEFIAPPISCDRFNLGNLGKQYKYMLHSLHAQAPQQVPALMYGSTLLPSGAHLSHI